MPNNEHSPLLDDSFELSYGGLVADLVIQSRAACHDKDWLQMAAGQLTDMVTAQSGMEREDVRSRLNAVWTKIKETGVSDYLERRIVGAAE